MARPTIFTEEVRRKMEEAAAFGCSDTEIAFYAGIHRDTFYDWMRKFPELSYRIDELKEQPILKARETIVNSLADPENAKWYLERKKKGEFAQKQELEASGTLNINLINYGDPKPNDPPPIPTSPVPIAPASGDGQRMQEGGDSVA